LELVDDVPASIVHGLRLEGWIVLDVLREMRVRQQPNSMFSLVPELSLACLATRMLHYSAKFNHSVLGIPAAELVRLEAIVSFGNAGGRSGSGAVCKNVDINGDGTTNTGPVRPARRAGQTGCDGTIVPPGPGGSGHAKRPVCPMWTGGEML